MSKIKTDDWHGLYRSQWVGDIVPEAMSHPAKFAKLLILKIYSHAIQNGWIQSNGASPPSVIIDPFGGVALGALHAILSGMEWVGVEIEPKFVELGRKNIDFWLNRYISLPRLGVANLILGDSRNLSECIKEANLCISSPPFESVTSDRPSKSIIASGLKMGVSSMGDGYGSTDGQLGNMRGTSAGFDIAISSPPYAEARIGQVAGQEQCGHNDAYSRNEGQLGAMKEDGDFWTAARDILEQLYKVIVPNGVAIWVTKEYIKGGELMPFPKRWEQLCNSVGFETICRHRAWVVEELGTQIDLFGNDHVKKVERKSFFRRLAESRGSPRIDWETVICMRRGE